MKLWLSKNSEVSICDQLVEQITLGIASRDLAEHERLPSIRELSRRFQIHLNTVLAGYRRLAAHGLVEFKKGTGVYVCPKLHRVPADGLDKIINKLLKEAGSQGYSSSEVATQLQGRLRNKRPTGFLLIESDMAMQKILLNEIEFATECPVDWISFEEFSAASVSGDSQLTAMFHKKETIQDLLPSGRDCIFLQANSVPASLSGNLRPSNRDLIAVV